MTLVFKNKSYILFLGRNAPNDRTEAPITMDQVIDTLVMLGKYNSKKDFRKDFRKYFWDTKTHLKPFYSMWKKWSQYVKKNRVLHYTLSNDPKHDDVIPNQNRRRPGDAENLRTFFSPELKYMIGCDCEWRFPDDDAAPAKYRQVDCPVSAPARSANGAACTPSPAAVDPGRSTSLVGTWKLRKRLACPCGDPGVALTCSSSAPNCFNFCSKTARNSDSAPNCSNSVPPLSKPESARPTLETCGKVPRD
jgi:hypothetical protein